MTSNATRTNSGFLGFDSLLVSVIATFGAHTVRSLHRAAAWAGLQRHERRGFVRIARALLTFGRSSFRYGHWSSLG
ncbi:MAG: hypothetical protein ACT4P6_01670 [Gemmatimonadaceae bacterium]